MNFIKLWEIFILTFLDNGDLMHFSNLNYFAIIYLQKDLANSQFIGIILLLTSIHQDR